MTTWKAEQDATLLSLHAEGKNIRAVAEALGVSRNAVIGRSHRLGVRFPRPEPKGRKPRKPDKRRASERKMSNAKSKLAELLKVSLEQTSIAPENGVYIADLEFCHCRWPIWRSGDQPTFFYCGKLRHPLHSYCEDHCEVAFNNFRG